MIYTVAMQKSFFGINAIILYLLFSDLFIATGFGLIDPILAVFFTDHITGGTVFTVGVASAIFMITKSLVQLPFSRHVDLHGDREDLKWLIRGTCIIAVVPFFYLFANDIVHVFLIQFVYGVGAGIAYATWLGMWSLHLDKAQESFEWSLYSTISNIGTALAAVAGAAVAALFGFDAVFIFVGVLSIIGALLLVHLWYQAPIFAHTHE